MKKPVMSKQSPSASKDYTEKARTLLWAWGLTDADYIRCYPEVLRFAEWAVKRVAAALSAETERCAMIADDYGREGDRLGKEFACETADEIAARIRAPAERPTPPAVVETKTITAAGIVGDWQRKWSINQEQFNAALDDLELEIRRALSAVTSEQQATWRDAYAELARSHVQLEARLARLQGLDVREAVAQALVRSMYACADENRHADAAIARIVEMLTP